MRVAAFGLGASTVTFAGCSLTSASIGVIVAAIREGEEAESTAGGTLTLTGGSNAASTSFSAQTSADIAYLNANGWVVTTN